MFLFRFCRKNEKIDWPKCARTVELLWGELPSFFYHDDEVELSWFLNGNFVEGKSVLISDIVSSEKKKTVDLILN